jgi:hypothetical protein
MSRPIIVTLEALYKQQNNEIKECIGNYFFSIA